MIDSIDFFLRDTGNEERSIGIRFSPIKSDPREILKALSSLAHELTESKKTKIKNLSIIENSL
jgi:hypothetical protein